MHREALSPERAVEAFADAVFDRFAGPGKVEQHLILVGQVIEGGGGELRPIIALHDLR